MVRLLTSRNQVQGTIFFFILALYVNLGLESAGCMLISKSVDCDFDEDDV